MSDFNGVNGLGDLEFAVDKANALLKLLASEITHGVADDGLPEPLGIIMLTQDVGSELKQAFAEVHKQWREDKAARQPGASEKGGES